MNRINAMTGTIEYVPEIIEIPAPREGVYIPEDIVTEIDTAPVMQSRPDTPSHAHDRGHGRGFNHSQPSSNPLSGLMNLFSPRREGHRGGEGGAGSGGLLSGLSGLFGGGGGKGDGLGGLLSGGLGGILERLSPDKLELEDLMLMMILYFLYRESGDTELLIIMAAMFFLD